MSHAFGLNGFVFSACERLLSCLTTNRPESVDLIFSFAFRTPDQTEGLRSNALTRTGWTRWSDLLVSRNVP